MARTGLEDKDRRQGAWHRTLVYFGLADGDDEIEAAAEPADGTTEQLRALERRVDEHAREIDALRRETERLRSR